MKLEEGEVYRTKDLRKLSSNPTRLAQRLVQEGKLLKLRNGLFQVPKKGAFGCVPPSEDAILKALFGSRPYLKTGPSVWNSLGLGTTAVETIPLVYNKTKTDAFSPLTWELVDEQMGYNSFAAPVMV